MYIMVPEHRSSAPTKSRANLVGLGGFEPPTSPLSGVRSNQLSYRPNNLPFFRNTSLFLSLSRSCTFLSTLPPSRQKRLVLQKNCCVNPQRTSSLFYLFGPNDSAGPAMTLNGLGNSMWALHKEQRFTVS
jgi:hypothetical protein